MSKQKIKLVSGRASAFTGKVSAEHVRKSVTEKSGGAAVASVEVTMLLEKLLATVVRATGAVAGAVRIFTPDRQLRMLGSIGLPARVVQDEDVVEAGCGACGQAANGWTGVATVAVCERRCGAACFGITCKQVLAVPLVGAGNPAEPIGVLTLFFEAEQGLSVNVTQHLLAYAALISASLESAMTNVENRRVTVLAERQSIANEIHDALAQTLYYAKMRSSLLLEAMRTENELLAYKCARDIDEALDSGQKSVRELVTHFRCQMDPRGLQLALETLVQDFRARSDITLEYVNREADMALPLEYELQTLLIVREALVNVSTHSGATAACLTVEKNGGGYVFTVADNGAGCSNAPKDGHYGLLIMRERAMRMGGEVQVESKEGLGTSVRLKFLVPMA